MNILRTLFLFFALWSYAYGAVPSKSDVLKAVSTLESNFVSEQAADAAKVVTIFAQESEDITIVLGPSQTPWINEKWGLDKDKEDVCKSMLLAAYLAGNIRFQLTNAKPKDDPYPGWILVINGYHQLQRKVGFHSLSIDALADMDAKDTLRQHANEVMKQQQSEAKGQP